MLHIHRFGVLLLLILMVYPAITGCGKADNKPPVIPQNSDIEVPRTPDNPTTDIKQWGTWIIRCHDATDETPASVEAIPLRSGELRLDIAEILLPPECENCMEIIIMGVIDDDWTLHVELTNPTIYTGYDVMGVFPDPAGPTILIPDSYTDLFDIDGDSSTHNPYIVFDTGNPNRAWGPGESHSQTLTFHRAEGEKFTDLIYVVAASWPGNQEEVIELRNPQVSGKLHTDASNPVTFTVEAIDRQDDIEYVLINMEPLNGSAYTHMQAEGDGIYMLYNYAQYGLSPGSETLLIAAKSHESGYLTYTYIDVEIIDPPPPPTNFIVLSGPTELTGAGAPSGAMDLAVVGRSDGTSSTLVNATSTEIYSWNTDYSSSGLFVTLTDPGGEDPNFPVAPVSRIAVTDPVDPVSWDTLSILQTNLDDDIWDETTDPDILHRNIMQLLDLEYLQVIDFKVTADNVETVELDAILMPVEVSSGTNDNSYGYALWTPDGGAFPGYYPFVALMRYEPPYKDATEEYDTLIGGVIEGSGDGKIRTEDVTGLAVWDCGGEGNLVVIVSEGGDQNTVEIFTADYISSPGGQFTPVMTLSGLVGTPLDVAILPVGDSGDEDENWFCILTDARTIETYTFSGDFVESVYKPEVIPATPTYFDIDTENLRIHVLMNGPMATVFEYTGMD